VTPPPDDTLEARFAARMGQLLGPDFPKAIGVAVSGGGDSMALLALAHGWARDWGVSLLVATVDHGLRAASAAEAAMVARECAALGHPHATLNWTWDGTGNLQDAARRARLDLIGAWRGAVDHVLFGHTLDDLAETFLMRLARGSGVEGLSAMDDKRQVPEGFWQVRPLLGETRADLRHYADILKLPYVDDPSNDDPRFDRVKARVALGSLAPLGLTRRTLVETAGRMSRAGVALRARAADVAARIMAPSPAATGHILFVRDGFAGVERDTQLRLLAGALQYVSAAPYRPRAAPLEALLDRVLSGAGGTLHGAQIRVERENFRIFREYQAVRDLMTPSGAAYPWDRAWRLSGAAIDGLSVRALGPDGWAQITERKEKILPYDSALSLPAVFEGARLVACRALDFGPVHTVSHLYPPSGFIAFVQTR